MAFVLVICVLSVLVFIDSSAGLVRAYTFFKFEPNQDQDWSCWSNIVVVLAMHIMRTVLNIFNYLD